MSWAGKILRVNLTAGTVTSEPLRMDWAKLYLGSRGLAGVPLAVVSQDVTITQDGTSADFNGDGLPDAWQSAYFGTSDATNAVPGADPDGDGAANRLEYLAGTNPTNANSVIRITAIAAPTNLPVRVDFTTGTNHLYTMQMREDLVAGYWLGLSAAVPGNNGVQNGTALGSNVTSFSFIFGIGSFPSSPWMTTSTGSCSYASPTVTCSAATLAAGQAWSVTITGQVTAAAGGGAYQANFYDDGGLVMSHDFTIR